MQIFFSVGEPSGDQHGAHLIEELRRRSPDLRFSGFGGPKMEAAGCRLEYRLTDLAVMGVLAVLPMLRKFYRLIKQAEAALDRDPPDAVVLIDFPGFNWQIARIAKARGIPVIYYLPPQLWAWGPWRIRRVRKWVDHVLTGLKFEHDWYRQRGVAAEWVGHPFFDDVARRPLDREYCEQLTDGGHRVLGVLPGSRTHEVRHNWPTMIAILKQVQARHPDLRLVAACYKESFAEICREQLAASGETLPVEFVVGRTPEVIAASHCCLMKSGSASLEMLARTTPAAVIYHVSRFTYPLLRLMVRLGSITLPNLMAGRRLFPEWLVVYRKQRVIDEVVQQLDQWLSDPAVHAAAVADLAHLRDEVAQPGGTVRAAEAILQRLPARRHSIAA